VATNFDSSFYVTCATVIPVLFLAVAVQGAVQGLLPYEAVLRWWRVVGHARDRAQEAILEPAMDVLVVQYTNTAAPPKRWEWVRIAGAVGESLFLVLISWVLVLISRFLALIAFAIVVAGAGGEFLALNVLYRGSQQSWERWFVLAATLVLVVAVAIGPVLAYVGHSLGAFVSRLKSYSVFLSQYVSLLKQLLSRNKKTTGEAGDAAAKRNQYAALLARKRGRCPEHPDTLATRAYLAYWTGKAGDAAAARDQCAALLPILERVLGPEDLDTLATRADLAYWTKKAGDPATARKILTALLPVDRQVLGPEHPDTLTVRDNLAYWTRRVGGPARAAAAAPVSRPTATPYW
jgi:hypothetical protein